MDQKEFQKAYGKLVEKAWEDAAFKEALLSDPRKVFAENGIVVPDGMNVRMVENTEDTIYFVLPPERGDELSDEEMSSAAGGNGCPWYGCWF